MVSHPPSPGCGYSATVRCGYFIAILIYFVLWCVQVCSATGVDPAYNHLRPLPYDKDVDSGVYGSYPVRSFATVKLKAPRTNVLKWSPECSSGGGKSGYYFITPKGWKVSQPGPMILDAQGDLIWTEHFANEYGGQAYNLRVQEWKGEKVLTFWLGDDTIRGHGAGHFYMLNSSYEIINKVGAANELEADLHEFIITSSGTALLTIFGITPMDVRPLGRKYNDIWNQYIWDCVVQEVDLENGMAVFEWRASQYIDLKDTYRSLNDPRISQTGNGDAGTQSNPFDWFHINSVEKDDLGNYLISARYTHAIYYIDGKTKDLIWTLGGKSNAFMDLSGGNALNFAWQHDARFVPLDAFPESYRPPKKQEGMTTRLLTIFDNAADDWQYDYGPPYSRGLLLEITYPTPGFATRSRGVDVISTGGSNVPTGNRFDQNFGKKDAEKVAESNGTNPMYTVRIIREYINPSHVRSSAQGSFQLLPPSSPGKDSTLIAGFGLNPVITEFRSNGTVLCDMHFGAQSAWESGDVQSYRAYKFFDWIGMPKKKPDVAVMRNGDTAYVSWNGATEVKEWLLQTSDGNIENDWEEMLRVPKNGFETVVQIPREYHEKRYLRFTALDRNGRFLENGISDVLYRGHLWTAKIGQQINGRSLSVISIILLIVGVAGALWLLYQLYRQRVAKSCRRGPLRILLRLH